MSKLVSKFLGFLTSRTLAGVDKTGNRYFARKETIDGAVKEKRFVVFKGEEDPTSIPVERICWLNGQRKKAPTPQIKLDLRISKVSFSSFLVLHLVTIESQVRGKGWEEQLAVRAILVTSEVRDTRKHRVQHLTPLIKTDLRSRRDLVVLSDLGQGSRQRERMQAPNHNLVIRKFHDDACDMKLVAAANVKGCKHPIII